MGHRGAGLPRFHQGIFSSQHGQYVSCVAHAANDAVEQGLLTPKEKAQFVKEAAQSKN